MSDALTRPGSVMGQTTETCSGVSFYTLMLCNIADMHTEHSSEVDSAATKGVTTSDG